MGSGCIGEALDPSPWEALGSKCGQGVHDGHAAEWAS